MNPETKEESSKDAANTEAANTEAASELELFANSNQWMSQDFTYGEISQSMVGCDYQRTINIKGQGITGFSESGKRKIAVNKNLVIPSKMPNGTTIVGIGSDAFKGQGIETLTLPDNMTVPYDDKMPTNIKARGNFMIMAGAFSNNNLTSMNFPNGLIYIDTYAFRNNKLTTVSFPHTLWMIGNSAFDKNQLTSVQFPATNDFLFQMDAFAFSNNKLKSITLPYNCEKVDKNTFILNPGIEVVPNDAPAKEKTLGGVVWMYSSNPDAKNRDRLHHIERTAESQKSWHQRLIMGDEPVVESAWKSEDFTYSGTVITGLSQSGAARRVNDKDLILPDKNPGGEYITEIAAGTAGNCGTFSSASEVFETVKLPAKLVKIGNYAFFKNNLTTINLPSTLTEIGMTAFAQNCITSVTIPDSVTVIGSGVFSGQVDGGLKSVTLSKGLKSIPQSAFANNAILSLVIPEGVTSIGRMAFLSSPLQSLSLPGTVNTIESNAFKGHELASIQISGNIKVIASGAFAQNASEAGGKGSLKTLELQEGIEEIASKAFENSGLTAVTLPQSMKKIHKDAFQGGFTGSVTLITDNYTHISDKTNFPASISHQIKLNTATWKTEDFTYKGTILTGLSDSGVVKRKENRKLILPDKNLVERRLQKLQQQQLVHSVHLE